MRSDGCRSCRLLLSWWIGIQMTLEREQLGRARLLERVEPPLQLALDRHRVQLVPALASLAANENDARAFEHAEVLHDRETRELGEPLAERVCRQRPVAQRVEHRPPMRRAEGLPHLFVIGQQVIFLSHIYER